MCNKDIEKDEYEEIYGDDLVERFDREMRAALDQAAAEYEKTHPRETVKKKKDLPILQIALAVCGILLSVILFVLLKRKGDLK